MNLRGASIIIAITILFLGFATVAAFQAFGTLGIIFLILTILLATVAIFSLRSYRSQIVLIDEMNVGVIFNRTNNSFSRFVIGPEPMSNQNQQLESWFPFSHRTLTLNDPNFIRLKWFEELRGTITKKSITASGTSETIRTAEGIPISIRWKVSYTIDVTLIPENLKHKMARALPDHSDNIVGGKVERALKHLLEMRTIQFLYEQGAMQDLEKELCQRVYHQLSTPANLGFKVIQPQDISLGPIIAPPKVEKILSLAQYRKIEEEKLKEPQALDAESIQNNFMEQANVSLASLQDILAKRFNIPGIKSLCFHTEINYENLPGETLMDKCIELVQYCHRRQMIPILIQKIKDLRPDIVF